VGSSYQVQPFHSLSVSHSDGIEFLLLSPFGAAGVAFRAAFEALHQQSQKLDGLFFVIIDDDCFYLLLFPGRKRDQFFLP